MRKEFYWIILSDNVNKGSTLRNKIGFLILLQTLSGRIYLPQQFNRKIKKITDHGILMTTRLSFFESDIIWWFRFGQMLHSLMGWLNKTHVGDDRMSGWCRHDVFWHASSTISFNARALVVFRNIGYNIYAVFTSIGIQTIKIRRSLDRLIL